MFRVKRNLGDANSVEASKSSEEGEEESETEAPDPAARYEFYSNFGRPMFTKTTHLDDPSWILLYGIGDLSVLAQETSAVFHLYSLF